MTGVENVEPDDMGGNAGAENSAPDDRGGKRGSGKRGTI